jgi:hypothetical protein
MYVYTNTRTPQTRFMSKISTLEIRNWKTNLQAEDAASRRMDCTIQDPATKQ